MSKNPKHRMKKKIIYSRKRRHFQRIFSRKVLLTIGLFAAIVTSTIIVILNFTPTEYIIVEVGDTVTIKYTLWISDESGNPTGEPIQDGEFPIEMKENAETTGLIAGFYDALLGMVNGSVDPYVYLPACVDDCQSPPDNLNQFAVAGDGWDDRYSVGEVRCLSYGYDNAQNPGDTSLRFTPIIFRIEILNIVKGD
ncbi:MAG: hypothetical protein ACTSWY_09835 [Promethearchaeota archaeon]